MKSELSIFERKYALYVLMAVRAKPGLTKTELMRLDEGNERTKFVRIQELIEAELIKYEMGETKWNSMMLYLTPKGQIVASKMQEIEEELKK